MFNSRPSAGRRWTMPIMILKGFFAVATGMVGGYVHHGLGVKWGLLLMAGYFLGFWLWTYIRT
jgi:hypothetical protein